MIGIFCIISIKSAVDSLETNIKAGFSELGSNVIYVDKNPWNDDGDNNYWKYMKRPDPSIDDYNAIVERSKLTQYASFTIFTGGKTIKYNSNSMDGAYIMAPTYDYPNVGNVKFEKGRYFTPLEYDNGNNKVILGNLVAQELFDKADPIGKEVKLFGSKFQVIAVMEEEGDNMFNFINFDEVIWISYNSARRYLNVGEKSNVGKMLAIKTDDDEAMEELKDEVTGIIRSERRLRPFEDSNFAVNEVSMLDKVLDSVFSAMNVAAFIIGIFALIVGMFSVANIMFVSVKERTNLIGIKMALGAKRFIILAEFLIEAIILCVIGGLMGLALVFLILKLISNVSDFQMSLATSNMIFGLVTSIIVGIIAGIIPALQASKMDPVEAIRA